jgi:hypothetical protein
MGTLVPNPDDDDAKAMVNVVKWELMRGKRKSSITLDSSFEPN